MFTHEYREIHTLHELIAETFLKLKIHIFQLLNDP
jgi:hypothetical protein